MLGVTPAETLTAIYDAARSATHQVTGRRHRMASPRCRAAHQFFPALLERRRRIDQALFAVVMEAYVHGVSTRKVDDLVEALGADTGISKSEVSRICADLDVEVAAFRDRSLAEVAFPYVFLDAAYCKARIGGDRRGRGSGCRPGRGDRHRGQRRRPPGGARLRRRRQRKRRVLDRVPARP